MKLPLKDGEEELIHPAGSKLGRRKMKDVDKTQNLSQELGTEGD